MADGSAPLDRKARRRAEKLLCRAQRKGRILPRPALWATILLMLALYTGFLFLLPSQGAWVWTIFAMFVVPAWASLVVLVTSALSVPLEREAGTLDALRLTPLPIDAWVRAHMRTRLRLGLLILFAGLPFYLMPHYIEHLLMTFFQNFSAVSDLIANWLPEPGTDPDFSDPEKVISVTMHLCLPATFWRPVFGVEGFRNVMTGVDWLQASFGMVSVPSSGWGLSLLGGLGAFVLDATRLYAFAAIGTAVSVRARNGGRAIFWAALFGGLFLLVTVVGEWAGGIAILYCGLNSISWMAVWLALIAVVLEVGFGNLLVPTLALRLACRGAKKRLEG